MGDCFPSNANQGSYWGDHDWEVGDEDDAVARKAYEALLRVSLLQPTSPRFQDFAETVRQRAQTGYNYSFSDGEEVRNIILGRKIAARVPPHEVLRTEFNFVKYRNLLRIELCVHSL